MDDVRITGVAYLNTRPLIEGLDRVKGVDLSLAVPAKIAGLVATGETDVGLASLVDIASSGGDLVALPCGMIGCDGPTLTVRLFSDVAPSDIRTIAVDSESHTSVALATVLTRGWTGAAPTIEAFDAGSFVARGLKGGPNHHRNGNPGADTRPETVLLIGDKVIDAERHDHGYRHEIDLGEAWRAETGLPFMYACWTARADSAASSAVQKAVTLLDRQRRRNRLRIDAIAAKAAAAHGWPAPLAREYVGRLLRYDVTDAARTGAELFCERVEQADAASGLDLRWHGLRSPPVAAATG
ncbi:MAG: MqnA/MqnD/SBP family protein [Planctomycetota bacterium]